ncbi:MAG: hypothetical protein WB796_09815, partial [Candidatus Sulfotelmatobacter sp.]
MSIAATLSSRVAPYPRCHPKAAESSASPRAPNEGPLQLACGADAAGECGGPSAREDRGLQDDGACLSVWVLGTR